MADELKQEAEAVEEVAKTASTRPRRTRSAAKTEENLTPGSDAPATATKRPRRTKAQETSPESDSPAQKTPPERKKRATTRSHQDTTEAPPEEVAEKNDETPLEVDVASPMPYPDPSTEPAESVQAPPPKKRTSRRRSAQGSKKDSKTSESASLADLESPTAPPVEPVNDRSEPDGKALAAVPQSVPVGQSIVPVPPRLAPSLEERGEGAKANGNAPVSANRSRDNKHRADTNHHGQGVPRRDLPKQREAPLTMAQLDAMTLLELYKLARQFNIDNFRQFKKGELVWEILRARTHKDGFVFVQGLLDIVGDYGFLRPTDFQRSREDVYVSASQIRRFDLRAGDQVSGQARPPKDGERYFALLRVEAVNALSPEKSAERPDFDGLTPIFPDTRFRLETSREDLACRLVDIVAPIGRGQRGLIVAPPKAGKTVLLKKLANAISANSPDTHLMVLLIDERPEEVTDMERSVQGEVASSTFDEPPEDHIRVAEMVLERAKRLVEMGRDVVILLDSITRLARAYNLTIPASGRTLSGGMDPAALHKPKRFFGAARKVEKGGSLTILATALVDTGSRMDDVIYEEFKGTGNMELHLDRKLAERRTFPAVDIKRSGTRREDLLMTPEELDIIWQVRKAIHNLGNQEATELLLQNLKRTRSNAEFFKLFMASQGSPG